MVQTLVQLMESEQSGRLAHEAAEVLTLLTDDNLEQQAVMAQEATLQVYRDACWHRGLLQTLR